MNWHVGASKKMKTKKKKLLFVVNTLSRAGAEVAFLEMISRIDPKQYELYLYVMLSQGELIDEIPEYVHVLNDHYSNTSVLTKSGTKQLAKTVTRSLVKRGNAIRLLPYMTANTVRMASKKWVQPDKLLWRAVSDGAKRVPVTFDLAVAYMEGASTYYVADHVKAKKKAAFVHTDYEKAGYTRKLDKNCYFVFDKIYGVSNEVRDVFTRYYPELESRMDVFENLINCSEIRRRSKLPGGFTDDYDGMRILTVGRLTAPKALDLSIKAMRRLKDANVHARWYVLGEGALRKELEQEIAKQELEEDFYLLGAADNPYPYYVQADVYVHASRYEGKSIAVREAQVLGCPIIVSDCNANREQVTDGVDGCYCHLSSESIAKTVKTLLEDEGLRRRYGEAAAKKNNDGGNMLNKLLALIGE
jgi:glycosyltransferase involved in cell wall biosynthesis